jgi:predicted GH43/DUF377 family glycosyl hydrolase
MFFNSFTNWPGLVKIGYAVSTDGYAWELASNQPVLTSGQVPFGENAVDVSSVVVLDDGTWVMYFHTVRDGRVGYATADVPSGPWQPSEGPVLTGGPDGAWDEDGIFWPNVIRHENRFLMFYNGDSVGREAIGLAFSDDGLNWTKYDDPETTDPAHIEGDPVLVSTAAWESSRVQRPRVQFTPDGFVMIYAGGAVEQRGLALSRNGIDWEVFPGNPVFTPEHFPIPNARTWDTALLYHDGVYFYFMEIGGLGGTDLYLATHTGSLILGQP